MKSCVRGPGSE